MRRRPVLVLLLVACAGLAAARAVAARPAGTRGVTTITSQHQLTSYQLDSDAGGAATVMWTTERFIGPENEAAAVIRVRQQDAQHRWGRPVEIGGVTQTDDARLVESPSGAAAVVWYYVQSGSRSRTVLRVATRRSADGSWSAAKTIWSAGNADGLIMAVSVDAVGDATVAWAGYGPTNPAIWTDRVAVPGDALAAPQRLVAAGSGGTELNLAENGFGAAVLSWQRQLSPSPGGFTRSPQRFAEMAAQRPVGSGSWSAAQRLGTFSVPEEGAGSMVWGPAAPSSAVTATGTAAVAWRAGGGGDIAPLELSIRTPGSPRWSAPHNLTADPGGFGLIAGAGNQLVAVWSRDTARELTLSSATSADAIHWSAPARLFRIPGGTYGPVLARAADGRIVLAPLTGNHAAIQYATRSPTGHWSALKRVGTGDNPEVAVTSKDSITAVWETFNRTGLYKLEARTQP